MFTGKVFKTEESRDIIRTRYAQILSAFPFKQRYIKTTFGSTFVLEAGSADHPALILLHGSCSNSAFWFIEMSALSSRFHVLAVDILGEAGNSEENRLDLNGNGYADWLREVLAACAVKKAIVMGNSLGSWMALKFATQYPDCAARLILIAPSGLSGQNAAFLERAKRALAQEEGKAMDPSVALGAEIPKEVEEFINLIVWGYHPITEELPVFSDGWLKRLRMPILFIAGKLDVMVDAVTAAQRLGELIPEAEVHLLENVGHMVPNALTYVVPFLEKKE